MKLTKILMATAAVAALTACSDKDGELENPTSSPLGTGSHATEEVLSSTEAKEHIETATSEFMQKFNPEEQRPTIELCSHFSETFADFEFPDNFNFIAESNNPAHIVAALGKSLRSNDVNSAAATLTVYNIALSTVAGVYEPDAASESWVKTADSDDLVLAFKSATGQPAEIRIAGNGNDSHVDFTVDDNDEWDYMYGEAEIDEYHITIPANLIVTLSEGSSVLAKATVNSAYSNNAQTLSVTSDVNIHNIAVHLTVNGTASAVTEEQTVTIGGETIQWTKATLRGNNLLDTDSWSKLSEDEDYLTSLISSAEAEADLMGNIQVTGTMNNFSALYDAESYAYYYDYDSKADAEAAVSRAAALFNKNLTTAVYYGSTTKQASLLFVPIYEPYDWNDGWEYYMDCVLKFEADGSTYSFGDYFGGNRFISTSNLFESITSNYERLWNSIH